MSRAKKPTTPRVGRPARAGAAAEERVTVRLTADEARRWRELAASEVLSLADWIRERCNRS